MQVHHTGFVTGDVSCCMDKVYMTTLCMPVMRVSNARVCSVF
jgi:hypothetical protein